VLGFDVVFVPPASAETNLAGLARAYGAAAAAQLLTSPPEILLWVSDERAPDHKGEDGGDLLRVSEALTGHVEPELLALRAIELLRGRLLPVPVRSPAPEPAPPAPVPTPPGPSAKPPSPPPPPLRASSRELRLYGLASPSLLVSPGGLPPAFYIGLSGRLSFLNHLSAEAWAFLPLVPGMVRAAEGTMALRVFFLGAGADFSIPDRNDPLLLSGGAGVGPLLLQFEGRASPPWAAAAGVRWAALVYARAGIGYRVHPRVRVRFDIMAGPVFPEPVLRIAGREVAAFGRPAVFISLGAEVLP